MRLGGYGKRRKREAGRPAQGGLFASKGGFSKKEENRKIKLLSPLTAEFVPDQWSDDDVQDLNGRELIPYYAAVRETVEQYADDLLTYYDGSEEIRGKLAGILPTVEVHDGKLCGCAVITFRQDLSERQWNSVMEYIMGQYSDGWGEGFEQRDIEVDGGVLNVHFWQPERFEMVPIAEECGEAVKPARPPMELVGHDGNIFAIMGRAAKLLRENGQNAESLEMRRRVTHCDNYYKALGIISEYVETELSVPRDLSHDPAHIRKEKKRGGEER